MSGILAVWFLKNPERPKQYLSLSETRYRIKIIWIFFDFATGLMSIAAIIHLMVNTYLIPWQQIQIGGNHDWALALLINQNNVQSTSTVMPWQDLVVISGQACYMTPSNNLNPPYIYDFPFDDFWPITCIVSCILFMSYTAYINLKHSLYSRDNLKIFLWQYLSYSTVLSAAYFTFVESDYCL